MKRAAARKAAKAAQAHVEVEDANVSDDEIDNGEEIDDNDGGDGDDGDDATELEEPFALGSKSDLLLSKTEWHRSYDSADIYDKTRLDRHGMILIALLSKGDYGDGLKKCGPKIALGLAACGFASQLCNMFVAKPPDFEARLADWRERVKHELATNEQGKLPYKAKTLAQNLPADFPDLSILDLYLNPLISSDEHPCPEIYGDLTWSKPMDIQALARLAYTTFGYLKTRVHSDLRNLIWQGRLLEGLRFRALGHWDLELELVDIKGIQRLKRRAAILDVKVVVDPSAWTSAVRRGLPEKEENYEIAAIQQAKDQARYAKKRAAEGKEAGSRSKKAKEPCDPFGRIEIACPEVFLRIGAPGFYEEEKEKIHRRKPPKGGSRKRKAKEIDEGNKEWEELAQALAEKKARRNDFSPLNLALDGKPRPLAGPSSPSRNEPIPVTSPSGLTPYEAITIPCDDETPARGKSTHHPAIDDVDFASVAEQSLGTILGKQKAGSKPSSSGSKTPTVASKKNRSAKGDKLRASTSTLKGSSKPKAPGSALRSKSQKSSRSTDSLPLQSFFNTVKPGTASTSKPKPKPKKCPIVDLTGNDNDDD